MYTVFIFVFNVKIIKNRPCMKDIHSHMTVVFAADWYCETKPSPILYVLQRQENLFCITQVTGEWISVIGE